MMCYGKEMNALNFGVKWSQFKVTVDYAIHRDVEL